MTMNDPNRQLPTLVELVTAYRLTPDLLANIIRTLDEPALAALTVHLVTALEHEWHVSAVEMGMTDQAFLYQIGLSTARMETT